MFFLTELSLENSEIIIMNSNKTGTILHSFKQKSLRCTLTSFARGMYFKIYNKKQLMRTEYKNSRLAALYTLFISP